MSENIQITELQCCQVIEKLKNILYTCKDRPTKSPEYIAIESTIIELCDKLKKCSIKEEN